MATTDSAGGASPSLLQPGLAACIATAALAGLLFGFDTAVISGTTEALTRAYALSPTWLGITVSAALWGTLAGALLAGKPGDRYGSRDTLRVLALFYVIAGIGSALAWNWGALVGFRLLCGLAVGGSSVLAPVYISEIAPPARRGTLVAMFQFNVILGILVAYVSNAVIAGLDPGEAAWRWKLGVAAAPALLFLLLLFRIPHSPRWLVAQGRPEEARAAFRYIGLGDEAARAEIAAAARDAGGAAGAGRLSWRRHARPILLAILVAGFNQLSGINAFLYYLNDIFARSHSPLSPDLQAIIIGVVNMVFTLLGMALIDRLGRKTLLLIGSAGMAASLTIGGLSLIGVLPSGLVLFALIGFILFFAPSTGAVIWVYISEIFPTEVRARGAAIGASTHWGANAVIAAIFPPIAAWSAGAPFFFFAACMVVQLVVVALVFPETKGVPLEEMERRLGAAG
ncbi:sugar porter family MFS transporter [Sphingomonas morindae]|uniref:Sugar porter family MFS transporter n=1 Tax=Sphingomonas morindae TaxID=1541170 RepID=A0ABY4XCD6_9SPHN|nr:sugar porter family MFS transporter [Sphingomonas morindae]USI74406.1 sugar porter family MFS transporter [Sphingomonas morindae]